MELMERRRLDYLVAGLYSFLPSSHTASLDDPPAFLVDERVAGRCQPRVLPREAAVVADPRRGRLAGAGVPTRPTCLPRFVSKQRIDGLARFRCSSSGSTNACLGVALRGHAQPGARIVARTQLRLNGEVLPYAAWTDAAADGSYELVVPLPSGFSGESVETAPFYQVLAGSEVVAQLALPEQLIRDGAAIDL